MKIATKFIHAGSEPDPSTGAIMTPIYQTSTYVQAAPGKNKGYEYARSQNPTRKALEDALAIIENGKYGLAFSSGVAATDAVIKLLQPGDEVIAGNDMYGGTYRLFSKIFEKFGIRFHYIDMQNADNIKKYITPNTKLIWAETPTNPLMNICDIAAIVAIAKQQKILVCVDNTFASPYLQNPLDLGADIVMHSSTKYLGGHSDVIQGALMMNDASLREQLYFIQKSCGAVPGPMDCFLVLRGIKTLHVRMKQHSENGRIVANWLRNHPKVGKVYWPGFEDHPGYAIAKKQMRDFGGMLSFTLKDDSVENAMRVLSSTHLFSLAESLGGVESLINHPASMTHASIPREERIKNGLSDSLIRLSVGIEDAEDLTEDSAEGYWLMPAVMNYIDYYAFNTYKTYLLANKIAPRLFAIPLTQAAAVAALYPVMLLFSLTVYLGIWSHIDKAVWQFISLLCLLSVFALLSSYFESKVKKNYTHYIKENKRQSFWGAVAINTIIALCILISIVLLMH